MGKLNVLDLFMKLVQIDSPTGQEKEMAKYIRKLLNEMGMKNRIDKTGNVVAYLPGKLDREPYFLSAHMDTVEPGRGIKPVVEKGWIKSGGDTILGADNKTAVAAILSAVSRLKENRVDHRPLELAFCVSEESGNVGAHNLNYSKFKARRGYISDASNYSFGDVIVASPYYVRIDGEILGKAAHSSMPEKGVNALKIFTKAFSKIKLGKVSRNTLVNIGVISGGEVVNTIPEKIVFAGEVRSMDEEELKTNVAEIKDVFKSEAIKHKGRFKFKSVKENDGFVMGRSSPFLNKTLIHLKKFGVDKPKLIRSWGCYDANIFWANGIEVVNIADGSLDAHTKMERVKVKDLERLADLFYSLALY